MVVSVTLLAILHCVKGELDLVSSEDHLIMYDMNGTEVFNEEIPGFK